MIKENTVVKKYIHVTDHAVKRYIERFDNSLKDAPVNVARTHVKYILQQTTTENKSFLNNTDNLIKLYEKYGYDSKYYVFSNNKLLFIGKEDREQENQIVIVTVVEAQSTGLIQIKENTNNFKGKKK